MVTRGGIYWRVRFLILGIGTLGSVLMGSAPAAQAQSLAYSVTDLATVRIFALERIDAQRIPAGEAGEQTVAVPVISHGSGLLVSAEGLILTAHHVVEEASALAVKVPGRERAYPAEVVYADADLDFAFMAVPGYFEHHVALPDVPTALRVRQRVHAIGYPVDPALEHPLSSPGIIAGTMGDGRLQLGISLNPGNSGGPLVDESEEVVGIVVARGDPHKGVLGLGVATPVEPIVRALAALPAQASKAVWGPDAHRLAALVVKLASLGPVGLLREAAEGLRGPDPLALAGQLEALAGPEGRPDLLALSAAYTWDALIMRLVDMGASQRLTQLPPQERARALRWLERTIRLCHSAARRDPALLVRPGFVSYVIDRWPDGLQEARPSSPRLPAHAETARMVPTAAHGLR